jgi:hypothetical protein
MPDPPHALHSDSRLTSTWFLTSAERPPAWADPNGVDRGSNKEGRMAVNWLASVTLAAFVLIVPGSATGFTVFTDAGPDTTAIQDTVDAFRAALGNPNNANDPGPLAGGSGRSTGTGAAISMVRPWGPRSRISEPGRHLYHARDRLPPGASGRAWGSGHERPVRRLGRRLQ